MAEDVKLCQERKVLDQEEDALTRYTKEPFTKWQRQLYINVIDFEKAFDSNSQGHLIDIIKSSYSKFSCTVGNSDIEFRVKTGVRQ